TQIKYVIGTGGALTRLDHGKELLRQAVGNKKRDLLLPTEEVVYLLDHDYILAALGVLSKRHPEAAKILLKKSLRLQ
ncbi:MAG: glutamate mutase L, partial [Eubacteriales bacterium]|nr:glutamate mutase L [Eubacteriales bacterium]